MSIQDDLLRLERDGELLRYRPNGPRRPSRRLYLSARAVTEHNDPASAVNILVGVGYFRAAFDRWALGNLVHGGRIRGRFIVPLYPPPSDMWEIKVTEPVAQGRAFGCFLEPDTFIVTHLHTRRFLDENNAWQTSINDCKRTWNRLFPGRSPFASNSIHDYITENCDDFPVNARAPSCQRRR